MGKSEIEYDYSIDNLKDYIEIIEKLDDNPLNEAISPILYRGESKNYYESNYNRPSFNSSAFRDNQIEGYETGSKLPFQKNIDAFRYEVWNEIDNDTRKHFLAFSQHHGIKTNLLDFSQNPLVGLYFAVQNIESTIGYVYLHESPLLDITPLFKGTDEINILDIICSNKVDTINQLLEYFWGFGGESMEFLDKYFYLLIDDYYKLLKNDEDSRNIRNISNIDVLLANMIKNDSSEYIKKTYKAYTDHGQKGYYYFIALRGFIQLKKQKLSPISMYPKGIIPMVYKPIMNFKRGINQNGLFLYQNYILSKGKAMLAKQEVFPSKIIKVTNKENILKALDKLNINSKYIFGDYSSIAGYIEDKHQTLRNYQADLKKNKKY